jgi:phage FluMu protein Com
MKDKQNKKRIIVCHNKWFHYLDTSCNKCREINDYYKQMNPLQKIVNALAKL